MLSFLSLFPSSSFAFFLLFGVSHLHTSLNCSRFLTPVLRTLLLTIFFFSSVLHYLFVFFHALSPHLSLSFSIFAARVTLLRVSVSTVLAFELQLLFIIIRQSDASFYVAKTG